MDLFPRASEDLIRARRGSRVSFSFNFRFCCSDALATTLSALYGKLLVVMGIAFPMAEVISTYIPPSFYEAFYLYLYFGSMIFLVYMYAMLFTGSKKPSKLFSSQFLSIREIKLFNLYRKYIDFLARKE